MAISLTVFVLIALETVLAFLVNHDDLSAISCVVGLNMAPIPEKYDQQIMSKNVEEYVSFYIHTKENPEGQEISLNEDSLKSSSFNPKRPTKIITHGYKRTRKSKSVTEPLEALLENGNFNVIVVDWSKTHVFLVIPHIYPVACRWVPKVGEYVARLIEFLESQGMDLETTTLIGHSLGAHVMGFAGYNTRNKVNFLIGLDPAGPSFETKNSTERLSPDAAATVLAIHTNEGDCGISQTVGHFDFYPNGGNKQPGCLINSCAHARAYELYAESIANEFYGRLCSNLEAAQNENCDGDTVIMDETIRKQKAKEGIYYFETNKKSPFAMN